MEDGNIRQHYCSAAAAAASQAVVYDWCARFAGMRGWGSVSDGRSRSRRLATTPYVASCCGTIGSEFRERDNGRTGQEKNSSSSNSIFLCPHTVPRTNNNSCRCCAFESKGRHGTASVLPEKK